MVLIFSLGAKPGLNPALLCNKSIESIAKVVFILSDLSPWTVLKDMNARTPRMLFRQLKWACKRQGDGMQGLYPNLSNVDEVSVSNLFYSIAQRFTIVVFLSNIRHVNMMYTIECIYVYMYICIYVYTYIQPTYIEYLIYNIYNIRHRV